MELMYTTGEAVFMIATAFISGVIIGGIIVVGLFKR